MGLLFFLNFRGISQNITYPYRISNKNEKIIQRHIPIFNNLPQLVSADSSPPAVESWVGVWVFM